MPIRRPWRHQEIESISATGAVFSDAGCSSTVGRWGL